MIKELTLSSGETRLLDFLLAGDSPVLEILRAQWKAAELVRREMTDSGFFLHFRLPPESLSVPGQPSLVVGDVRGWIDGIDCGFLLFVREGRLDFLECHAWRDEELDPDLTIGALEYLPGTTPGAKPVAKGRPRKRDLAALHRSWDL